MNERAYRDAERRFWASIGRQPDERFVPLAVTGTRVRVLEVGEGDPVLFLHGGPNAGSTWVPLVEHLDGVRCLIVDRPGTGLSEPCDLRAATLPEVGARFVGDLLDGLELERAHVVASSFGGHLALRSAAHDPSRFLRMVQMACPALVPGDTAPPFMRSLGNPVVRWLASRLPPTRRGSEDVLRQIGHGASLDAGRLPPAMDAWYDALQRHTDTRAHDFALIADVIRHRSEVGLTPDLLAVADVPTLFLWGADDAFGGETVARSLVAAMPDAELIIIDEAGHLPWLDFPERLARDVAAFLAPARPATLGPDPGAVLDGAGA
jgi:pimeloyl-ACP methyl ester carboxylesterase